MFEAIHELALVKTPLHLEGLHLHDVQRLLQKLLLIVHVDVDRAGHPWKAGRSRSLKYPDD